jgi:hypothetical protein
MIREALGKRRQAHGDCEAYESGREKGHRLSGVG